jgi:hypothetical protein
MFVGHFAVGLAAKRAAPAVSLGTLVLAAMLADLLWCLFIIAGIEHVQFKPGMGAAQYLAFSDITISHSLSMDALWAGLSGSSLVRKAPFPVGGGGAVRDRIEPLVAGLDRSPAGYAARAGHPKGLRIRTLDFGPRRRDRRWCLAARDRLIYSRYASPEPRGCLRVLERHRPSYAGVVQQHRRATPSRSARGAVCQLRFLFPGGGLGLLDEPGPARQRPDNPALTRIRIGYHWKEHL